MNTDILKITPSYNRRTFTIRKYDKNYKKIIKYRTFRFTVTEFEEMQFNTVNDWKYWLRTNSNDYEAIKYY